jgi:YNFM family putative membrane transporter
MSTGEPSPTSTRRTVAAVFLAGVAVFLVLYETQGLLPAIREAYGIDGPTASLTVSATNVAMAVFLIPFSMLAGRIGHARQIGAGVIVAAILALILPFTPTPELLIAVRFLQGVAIASVPATAMAYLSLRLPSQALPGAIGVYIAGNTIGGLCSRLLTGLAAELLGWHGGLAFTAPSPWSSVSSSSGCCATTSSPRPAVGPPAKSCRPAPRRPIRWVRSRPRLGRLGE